VTATTTSPAKLGLLEQLGADGVVMDGLDAVSVGEAVAKARPDAIVHQMTAISMTHAGKPDMKHFDRLFATTNRLRTEGTDHLLAAAEATGVSTFVAESFGSFNGIRRRGASGLLDDFVRDLGMSSRGITGLSYQDTLGTAHPSANTLVSTAIIDGYFFLGGILYGRAARSYGPARRSLRRQAWRASQQGERE
jgi:hypothetical protein